MAASRLYICLKISKRTFQALPKTGYVQSSGTRERFGAACEASEQKGRRRKAPWFLLSSKSPELNCRCSLQKPAPVLFFEQRNGTMLSGKRFKLEISTVGVEIVSGKRVAVTVPAGDTIKVVSGPRHTDAMMDVLWEGRVVMLFAIDVEERGTEIAEKGFSK